MHGSLFTVLYTLYAYIYVCVWVYIKVCYVGDKIFMKFTFVIKQRNETQTRSATVKYSLWNSTIERLFYLNITDIKYMTDNLTVD